MEEKSGGDTGESAGGETSPKLEGSDNVKTLKPKRRASKPKAKGLAKKVVL